MSNKAQPDRQLLLPADDFDLRKIPVARQPMRHWFRVHRSSREPLFFGKFHHHRFSHPDCPYPLLYLGASIQTCLWEVFGDDVFQDRRVISEGRWMGSSVAQITVPEIKVCAAQDARTRDAMSVDKASLLAAHLAVPQAWGLAVQRHPAQFQALKYTSRFVDQACLALFDRDGVRAKLKTKSLGPLATLDPALDWLHERQAALV